MFFFFKFIERSKSNLLVHLNTKYFYLKNLVMKSASTQYHQIFNFNIKNITPTISIQLLAVFNRDK